MSIAHFINYFVYLALSIFWLFGTASAQSSDQCQAPSSKEVPTCEKPSSHNNKDSNPLNVLGQALSVCSMDPKTGFFRDGTCRTAKNDHGSHVVCGVMTKKFLDFTKSKGNDLSTPVPRWDFPGLKAGDQWCLCAIRWAEAEAAGKAPPVILEGSHEKALHFVEIDTLRKYAQR